MEFCSKYTSKAPDENGFIFYTPEENKIWKDLITNQLKIIEGRACDQFIDGLKELNLPSDRIPQLGDISKVMLKKTGWKLQSVPSLITFEEFFELLSQKVFPVATFIRNRDEFEYLQEPDLFHELFGHCPMLLNQKFADFTQAFGKLALKANAEERAFLGRLYWFTAEFGLIESNEGTKIYGGGILSSPSETNLSLINPDAARVPFNIMEILRTPYRIDIVQPIYFQIKSFAELLEIINNGVYEHIHEAMKQGMLEPLYI